MTLHWWMHWFWVTLFLLLALSSTSLSAPQSEELQHITSDSETVTKHTERQGRAMYFSKPVSTTVNPFIINITDHLEESKELSETVDSLEEITEKNKHEAILNPIEVPEIANPQSKSSFNPHEVPESGNSSQISIKPPEELPESSEIPSIPLEVVPKTNTSNATVIHPGIQRTAINDTVTVAVTTSTEITVTKELNNSESITNTTISKRKNSTPDFKDDSNIEGLSESRIVTEKPLSLETSYLQTRSSQPSNPNIESYRRVDDGMDTGAIAGISFAALVLVALVGSTAFVLYRRRYLNKPLTLNDKCSNPDSSGYLDDSTVKDNSEEMYSLDNDSFLNSLEAMTIQNYWTDTVKHTKL